MPAVHRRSSAGRSKEPVIEPYRGTLPEELLLLAHDPVTGRELSRAPYIEYGVAGAILAELERAGRVRADGGRLGLVDPAHVGDPGLDWVLDVLCRQGAAAGRGIGARVWIRDAGLHVVEIYRNGLVACGALRVERRRMLGVFPYDRYPVGEVDWTTPVRERVDGAARSGQADTGTHLLAGLVAATGIDEELYPGFVALRLRRTLDGFADGERTADTVQRLVESDESARTRRARRTRFGSGDGGSSFGGDD
ncbi:GPP34 family phosphoprotein [Streptomyces sp. NPDC051776]|uniref:GOLPH3/VPS74 family protein n=1 Tax=Streptomyces sp. NPDC051776 TaxID=3155414 RepID=UPI00342A954B